MHKKIVPIYGLYGFDKLEIYFFVIPYILFSYFKFSLKMYLNTKLWFLKLVISGFEI